MFKFKWEYQILELHTSYDLSDANFANQGVVGWELVQIVPAAMFIQQSPLAYAIFKRIAPEDKESVNQMGYAFTQAE